MHSKLIASIAVYNDVLFFDYVMRSIEPFVDEIIITDTAFKEALEAGLAPRSTGVSRDLIESWIDNKKIFLAPTPPYPPVGHELSLPGFNVAKEHGADWYFTVGPDEIWTPQAMKFLKPYLEICNKKGILGLNVWMHNFGPDFWHAKDGRNPRIAKMTPGATLCPGGAGDAVMWIDEDVYQYAGDCNEYAPSGVPKHMVVRNGDFPKNFRIFHYTCVGRDRLLERVIYGRKKNSDGLGSPHHEAHIKEDWEYFKKNGYKDFLGKHPDIILNHPLYSQKLY